MSSDDSAAGEAYRASRLAHAAHNEAACDHLGAGGAFPDWVVTTAFYAALHYVEAHLFPRTERVWDAEGESEIEEFETFDAWYDAVGWSDGNKHSALRKLVKLGCPVDVSTSYRALFENSHTARYRHYQTSEPLATKARRDLGRVKAYCAPES